MRARSTRENFHVASRLLPRELRGHFLAVYGYCRAVDDLGDEAPGDRLALLDGWERELDACYAGRESHPVFRALAPTIQKFSLPRELFWRLIEANRIDQRKTRHETFADLLDYCAYSADPVGRLVLRLLGAPDPELDRLSDATCTALQLANFWQDVTVDWGKGRVYLPQEDLRRFGCAEPFEAGRAADGKFRALMKFEVDRTREWFARGVELADRVDRRFRRELILFTAGGSSVLDRIERQGYDVLSRRPALSWAGKTRLLCSVAARPGAVMARLRSRRGA